MMTSMMNCSRFRSGSAKLRSGPTFLLTAVKSAVFVAQVCDVSFPSMGLNRCVGDARRRPITENALSVDKIYFKPSVKLLVY